MTNSDFFQIRHSWKKHLQVEFEKPYMQNLKKFLEEEKNSGAIIYPSENEIFSAFEFTPFDDVRVVIMGQDPYHGPGQAHGLSFSVKQGLRLPPSLKNIFQEIENDLNIRPSKNGFLKKWAEQGVLMLNSVLTVRAGAAASHQKKGWEEFTDKVIAVLNEKKENLVFVLWGSPAQKKGAHVDKNRHLVLEAPHPSPLSAYRGFLGCKHFSKTNQHLKSISANPIDWTL